MYEISSSSSFCFILVSHFLHVCFSIISNSHPLYFSYFIFFFPHLLSFISFLSPLFITTTLLLLSANFPAFSHSKFGFLLSVFQFSSSDEKMDEKVGFFDEFQAYLDVFQAPMFESPEESCSDHDVGPMEKEPNHEQEDDDGGKVSIAEDQYYESHIEEINFNKEPYKFLNFPTSTASIWGMILPMTYQNSHESNTKLEDMFCQKEDTESNKAEESEEEKMSVRNSTSGSKEVVSDCTNNNNTKIDDDDDDNGEYFGTPEIWEIKHFSSSSIGSYGSMRRKEKEWRRTLACKLYEERQSVIGSEGMDLLWETYDDDDDDTEPNKINNTNGEDNDDEDDDDDGEKGMNGKYCCLHALKFSAGKMNLGIMRRPNLVKISKALKGIGLLHHVSKYGRKGYQ